MVHKMVLVPVYMVTVLDLGNTVNRILVDPDRVVDLEKVLKEDFHQNLLAKDLMDIDTLEL